MRAIRSLPFVAMAATTLAAACVPASRYHEPQIPDATTTAPSVDATAAALAGDWVGAFDVPFYERRGTMRLSLERVAHVRDGVRTSTVAGSATFALASTPTRIAIDSARVGRGRAVFFLAPFADQETGATVRLRLDGALAADTLGGRLRGDGAATVPSERHGGWRLVRVPSPVADADTRVRASRSQPTRP